MGDRCPGGSRAFGFGPIRYLRVRDCQGRHPHRSPFASGCLQGTLRQIIPLATVDISKGVEVYHSGPIYAGDWPAPGTVSLWFGNDPPPAWQWYFAEDEILLAAGNDNPGSIIGDLFGSITITLVPWGQRSITAQDMRWPLSQMPRQRLVWTCRGG
jgi:hypothetical protein